MLSNTTTPWLVIVVTVVSFGRGCEKVMMRSLPCGCGRTEPRTQAAKHEIEELVETARSMPHTAIACVDPSGVDDVSPTDPWGRPWRYECHHGALTIRSLGEDGVAHTLDDITAVERDDD